MYSQCRTKGGGGGGGEGHVPPPPTTPEEAKKKPNKENNKLFVRVLLKEKVGVTDRAVTPACK